VHEKNVNPRIYGKANLDVGALSYFLNLVTTDPLVLYTLLSLGACHRLLCMNKKVNLDEDSDNTLVKEALFYLFEAMRLLQEKFDNTKEALSSVSIFIAAMLATTVVSWTLRGYSNPALGIFAGTLI
jgi:hypothetical protein